MDSVGNVMYAGFWRRLAAALLDLAILAPVAALWYMLFRLGPAFVLYMVIPQVAVALWYRVYLVARFGGSPGKLITGLRITMIDGSPVTGRAAFLRFAVDIAFGITTMIVSALAVMQIPEATFYALNLGDWREALEPHIPAWHEPFSTAGTIWMWSELLVLLTNRKRRAIHDFIAGTVVVHRPDDTNTDGLPRRTPLPQAGT